jgi:hypothetical protein
VTNKEVNKDEFPEVSSRFEKFAYHFAPILLGLTFLTARALDVLREVIYHTGDTPLSHLAQAIHIMADIAFPFIAFELLVYVVVERGRILVKIKAALSGERGMPNRLDEMKTHLLTVPSADALKSIFDTRLTVAIDQLRALAEAELCATPEEVYTRVIATIKVVERTTATKKRLLHGILHHDVAFPQRSDMTEPPYFTEFKKIITSCIGSRGASRWDVKTFYNITSLERLKVIEERLEHGDEGYEVRAISYPNTLPAFSPMVLGEEDAFLGIIEGRSSQIGSALHLHGKGAASFVAEYFFMIWNFESPDKSMFHLRDERGINSAGVAAIRALIRARTKQMKTL